MGVGLGHAFLRHVQRTRALVHLLDGASADPLADYNQINVELSLYDEHLLDKPQIVVFNKIDLPEAQARWPEVQAALKARGVDAMVISAATRQGVRELTQRLLQVVDALPPEDVSARAAETPLYELPEDDFTFTITREPDGSYRVAGKRIERAAAMTYWDYDEAVARFQNILEAMGVTAALERAGVEVGDTVYIGAHELEWSE